MRSSITATGQRSQQWQAPEFSMPMQTHESELRILGTDHLGRTWRVHRTYGELVQRRQRVAVGHLPDGPYLVTGEPGMYITFDPPQAPGSFERFVAPKQRPVKPPPPVGPIDVLAALPLVAERPERIAPSVHGAAVRPARPRAKGPDQIIGRLAAAGATVALSEDGASLVLSSAGGVSSPEIDQLFDRAEPLLLAHLQGRPTQCRVTKHAKPVPAITVTKGGTLWCGECSTKWHELAKGKTS